MGGVTGVRRTSVLTQVENEVLGGRNGDGEEGQGGEIGRGAS